MNMLLWAGLTVNALVHLRYAILKVQDGEDRYKAGQTTPAHLRWANAGDGNWHIAFRVICSPVITASLAIKFLLFPRGIKSKFAKEQEAKAKAAAKKKEQELLALQLAQAQELIRAWAPGEVLLATPEPADLALGWNHAADAFDAFSDLVARTAGQPWSPAPPPSRRVKATVGDRT
jgi:hypothetical protein